MISKHIVIWHMVTIVSVLVVMTVLSRRPLAPWHNASDDAVVHVNSARWIFLYQSLLGGHYGRPPERSKFGGSHGEIVGTEHVIRLAACQNGDGIYVLMLHFCLKVEQ
jgi:hypothetical protein